MLTSVAIHLAFALLISVLISTFIEPSIVDRVLVLNLKLPPSNEGLAAGKTIEDHLVSKRTASTTPIPDDHSARETGLEKVRIEVPAKYESPPGTESRVLASAPQREHFAPASQSDSRQPDVVTMTISPAQEKMLTRKIKQWSRNFDTLNESETGMRWKHHGKEYQASFRRQPAKDNMSKEYVLVDISTRENGYEMSTDLRMKRLTFSDYAQFVNYWDPRIQIHNDEMDGRFHSNSKIRVEYTRKIQPKFLGKVTTTSGGIDVVNARRRVKREQIFLGGLETGVKRIALPKHAAPFSGSETARDDQVNYLDQDTRITFYADGTYGWQTAQSPSVEQRVNIAEDAAYIISSRKRKLFIKGVVSGKVLVYSPERIIIEGNLTYADDPQATHDADDYLGLVSDKYIDIASPDITGPGDLLIYASIYAKRRFSVRNYGARKNAMLFIYGSLTAGSLSATEPRYYTKIQFDKRLANSRAPGFPMTNRYEVEERDNNWRVEPTAVVQ